WSAAVPREPPAPGGPGRAQRLCWQARRGWPSPSRGQETRTKNASLSFPSREAWPRHDSTDSPTPSDCTLVERGHPRGHTIVRQCLGPRVIYIVDDVNLFFLGKTTRTVKGHQSPGPVARGERGSLVLLWRDRGEPAAVERLSSSAGGC